MSDLTELRDRIIGIILGVIVASLIYLYLWPDSDAPRLRSKMATLYRQLANYFDQPAQQAIPLPIYQTVEQVTTLASRLQAEPLGSTTHPYQDASRWPIDQSIDLAQQLSILAMGYHRYAGSEDPFLHQAATWLKAYATYLAREGEYPIEPTPHPDSHNPYATELDNALRRLTPFQTTQEVSDGA